MFASAQNDTINKKDANGLKQGFWVFYFDDNTKKEEGTYTNNKKEGIWKAYYPTGNIKHEITYLKNRPNGYAKFYYENGVISEEGIWKINKWVGSYKMYHKNGNPSYDWNYSDNGKRSGEQKYFHNNGKIMIEGNWNNGKEEGVIKHYDENGKLTTERTFVDGKQDPNSIKYYTPDKSNNTDENKTEQVIKVKDDSSANKKIDRFDGNGDHKLYNSKGLVEQDGLFEKGKLKTGKKFYYDADNKITKIMHIKNFKVIDIQYKD